MAPCVVQVGRAKTIITTALTRLFDLTQPIVLGPMGGVAGGALAAAVSNAGGLGLVGGGYGDADWLRTELAIARADTTCAWGAGFITWSATRAVLDQVLAGQPHAVVLSFGDPRPFGAVLKAAGCKLICQVQDLATAGLAREAGADLVVAQGSEGGGHGAGRGTLALALAPAVVDAVVPIPVLAAGGIADGRGLAAALMLGAQGALIGTRFYASAEALGSPRARDHIVAARATTPRAPACSTSCAATTGRRPTPGARSTTLSWRAGRGARMNWRARCRPRPMPSSPPSAPWISTPPWCGPAWRSI